MSNPAFSTEQISVCGFGAEQETVNSSNAKAWLSLTPYVLFYIVFAFTTYFGPFVSHIID